MIVLPLHFLAYFCMFVYAEDNEKYCRLTFEEHVVRESGKMEAMMVGVIVIRGDNMMMMMSNNIINNNMMMMMSNSVQYNIR